MDWERIICDFTLKSLCLINLQMKYKNNSRSYKYKKMFASESVQQEWDTKKIKVIQTVYIPNSRPPNRWPVRSKEGSHRCWSRSPHEQRAPSLSDFVCQLCWISGSGIKSYVELGLKTREKKQRFLNWEQKIMGTKSKGIQQQFKATRQGLSVTWSWEKIKWMHK